LQPTAVIIPCLDDGIVTIAKSPHRERVQPAAHETCASMTFCKWTVRPQGCT